ncbi:MAG: VanZ family protein [Crocinitomicaceae bacterium]
MSKRTKGIIGICYVTLFVYLLYFAPFRSDTSTAVNLVPFKSISKDLYYVFIHGSSWEFIFFLCVGFFGKLFLLAPIPYFFDLNIKGYKKWLLVILTPIAIELFQFLLQAGSADIDDVFLNALGFYLGFELMKKTRTKRSLPRSE